MFDKINVVYTDYPGLGGCWSGITGLIRGLRESGRLGHAFNTSEFIDEELLQKYPILYIGADKSGQDKFIRMGGSQFKANLYPESVYTRQGDTYEPISLVRSREKQFDLIFAFAESDLNFFMPKTIGKKNEH